MDNGGAPVKARRWHRSLGGGGVSADRLGGLPAEAVAITGGLTAASRLKENFDVYLSAIKDSEKAIGKIDIT